ncbi:50S ribosomal protein L21 [Mesoterricola sediminis]|uniref:Large ribosomal subunit protein bL21 n=1 Tax=Mesoterricola sediminis TaxID=2927980 RepID=A0AA48KBL2_9BACT|nr:50S ribosomal protein L21 [Mesoterricola sediminis]BDU75200.1 50S ribosomal protein L21 [Mesoterricola sediminis]
MYAVIQTGGKQYRVSEGDIVRVELLDKEIKDAVVFDRVLLVDDNGNLKVGKPVLEGASVTGEVITHDRAKKVVIFKKKRTTTYQRTKGHRQGYTEVRIKGIQA